ncbi:MAG: Glycerol-3-phosphate dehydrogenase [Burkholderiales bacterium]|jgi:glycerol-3-phosphate dehydrogenase (NAD(P)+)|nr:Glycerol-3-phosphate dehydrogenase [Burkholderiales bacterium]
MKIAVLGAGAWGTAVGISLAQRHEIALWMRNAALCAEIRNTHTNHRYLPGFVLPANVAVEDELRVAISGVRLVLAAVTSNGLRETLTRLQDARCAAPVVWLCKGFETEHAKLPHQVHADVLGAAAPHGVLSGPSFAEEVARGLPTALTLASSDAEFARATARELHCPALRVYSGGDVPGVEVAGAVKNVMAIAAGICDGLALGLNARAALITRGLAEMTRLGVRLGGRAETFMGLAGVGDLVLTCTGDLSRNRRVGLSLGQGKPLSAILNNLGHVAEGVCTARAIMHLASELGVDMPITRGVCRVLEDPAAAKPAVQELLQREPKAEYWN